MGSRGQREDRGARRKRAGNSLFGIRKRKESEREEGGRRERRDSLFFVDVGRAGHQSGMLYAFFPSL
jgi:hypothetical protein